MHQFDRVGAAGKTFQALLYHCVGKHGGGGRAVAGDLVGLLGDLAQHLRAHVLERALQFDLLGDADAVPRDHRRADRPVDDRVHSLGPQRAAYGPGQLAHAPSQCHAGCLVVQHHFGHSCSLDLFLWARRTLSASTLD